jgi:hypothetical protein
MLEAMAQNCFAWDPKSWKREEGAYRLNHHAQATQNQDEATKFQTAAIDEDGA